LSGMLREFIYDEDCAGAPYTFYGLFLFTVVGNRESIPTSLDSSLNVKPPLIGCFWNVAPENYLTSLYSPISLPLETLGTLS
jgi:hypothetical protein